MLVEFDFAVESVAYVKAATVELPSFRPDGLDPAGVQALLGAAATVRAAYVTKKTTIDVARAARRAAIETLHDASVDFSAQARSRFRKNGPVMETLLRLPKDDRTMQETLVRGDATVALWATLPQIGTPPVDFTVGQGTETLTRTEYEALVAAARDTDEAIPAIDQDFQSAEAGLHDTLAALEDFATAAVEQGRSQFDGGTPEREIIDAIPTEPGSSAPAAATFASVTVSGTNTVTVAGMAAPRATSFDVQLLAPGETEFADHANAPGPDGSFGPLLAVGSWLVRIAGRNSQGLGPWSAPGSFETT